MTQPPPLAPVPDLTPNANTKKRTASQSGMNANLHQPPNKKYKAAPNTMQYPPNYPQHATYQTPMYPPHNTAYPPPNTAYPPPNTAYPPANTNYYHPQSQQPQYNARPNTNSTNSTRQYYERPQHNAPPKKSPTPRIETVRLSQFNNNLPQRITCKIEEAERKSIDNKSNAKPAKTMIPIARCKGVLFGPIEMVREAQLGEVVVSHKIQEGKHKWLQIHNTNNTYLGQCDVRLQRIFGDFVRDQKVKLKAKIVDADLQKLKHRLPPNRFVKQLMIDVLATHDIILNLVELTRKKVKNWKWLQKEVILLYFEGEEVEFNVLYDHVIDSIAQTEAHSGGLLQLENRFNDVFAGDITAEDLDGIDPFEEIVETKLLQHQRVGLEWMSMRENFKAMEDEDDIPPFYDEIEDKETGDIKYINVLNMEECNDLPELGCGGILADDMGLGKTLQCISLLASNSDFQSDREHGNGPTLIVAPLVVIGNWVNQFNQHCAKDAFRIMVYHGPNREKDLDVIRSHNIVITTFDIVALEYSDENDENREEMRKHYGCGLQYVEWLRVVLDEAHKIRSRKTRVFKACNALQAKSRWCLTGTPVQNRLDDLYSLFCFLKLQPICDKSFWNKFIIQPLKNHNAVGFERLRVVMKQLCLRRDKSTKIGGERIISLPDKVVKRHQLDFNPTERQQYLRLMAIHKAAFSRLKERGDKEIMRNFSSVLSMLLRLRQCCAHTLLVPELNGKQMTSSLKDLNIDTLDDANQECASCGMRPDGPTLTSCNHIYCNDCFQYELETHNGSFPCTLCGDKLTQSSVVEKRDKSADVLEDKDENEENKEEEKAKKKKKKYKKYVVPDGIIEPSAKMRLLINDVKSWNKCEVGGAPNQALVFSQWTSVLDILAKCLEQEKIKYERLDGSMTRATREAAMDRFRADETIPVFLMSLKAGNLGVNMTVANHVYMMDPWWNPATEDQAVDRCYRLGQKRNVTVNYLVVKDTVEEKILKIQDRKRKLISSALGQSKEDMKQERKKAWLEDLKDLFTMK